MTSDKPNKPKRRSPPYILGGVVLILLTFLVLLQSSNLWKSLTVETVNDTLLLYALSSLNFLAFIIFGLIFIRSLVKLRRERRAAQLGSEIKKRLLLYFFAVSLLPIIAMAVFSYLFLNRAIDRWFTDIPERGIREAQQVQDQSIKDQTVKLQETANLLVNIFNEKTLSNQDLQDFAAAGNLTKIEIISKTGEVLAEGGKNLTFEQKKELDNILGLVRREKFDEESLSDGKGFDLAAAKFPDGRMLIIVPDFRPAENVSQIVETSLIEFEKLKAETSDHSAAWVFNARRFNVYAHFRVELDGVLHRPRADRADPGIGGRRRRNRPGNLAHRVEVLAEDELALLVSTFNQMSAKLEENSAEISERRRYTETVLQSLSTGVISFDGKTA